ncbi:MAG: NAD-dependent epimerase/dehydratase family protein [Candidatus Midichloriaceae bacterium]|nr:NAD-dependent epimerase/dehydratase family protein [Candidatus Midichloriaceae bacterium]
MITGSSGLIGSALINYLSGSSYDIDPVDIRGNSCNFAPVDILDTEMITQIVQNCTGVIHLAAVSRVIWGEQNPQLCKEVNVDGTRNIINACLRAPNRPWLIYASSREVYGQQNTFPVNEEAAIQPHNHYAKSKVLAETLVNDARKDAGLRTAILRFSNVFGGMHDYSERVVPAFCYNAINNLPLKVNGADSILDFTYVDDVVSGLIKVIELMSTCDESLPPIHFTTGIGTSLLDLAELIISLSSSSSNIELNAKDLIYPSKFYGDYTRAKILLGWHPKHSIKEGILKYLAALKSNKAALHPTIMENEDENFKGHTRLSSSL